jgi:hypothetical protein
MAKNVDRHQSSWKTTLSCQLLRKGGKQMANIFRHEDTRATWRMGGQSAVMATVEL